MDINLITKDKRFWPLFWTQFLGAFNDNVFKNALVMIIIFKNIQLLGLDAKSLVALCGGIFILPFILFSAVAGQISDKFPKYKVIRATKYTELLFMIFAALGLYFENYGFLIVVLFLMGTQSAFFGPLKYGVIPELIERNELVKGNAFISMGTFIAILGGTIIGGLSAAESTPAYLLPLCIIVLSGIGIITSRSMQPIPSKDPEVKVDFTLFKPSWDILKITAEDKKVFTYILSISWYWFLGAGILSLIPPMVKDILHGGESVGTLFLGLFTVGMGAGSIFTEKISESKADVGIVNFSFIIMSAALVDLYFSLGSYASVHSAAFPITISTFYTTLPFEAIRVTLDMFVLAFAGGCYIVTLFALIQLNADEKKMARVIAGNNIWNAVFMVTAAVLVMFLHSKEFSIGQIFLVLGGLNLLSGFWFYLTDGYWAWRFLFYSLVSMKYKVIVHGKENIPEDGAVLLVCNHTSFIDWGILMAKIRRPIRFVIDHVYFYNPMFKWLLNTEEMIPIATRKEDLKILKKGYEIISEKLTNGDAILIFPEGSLTGDGNLKKFQPGILKILDKNDVNVIPMGLSGLWGSWHTYSGKGAFRGFPSFKRKEIHLHIGKPIKGKDYNSEEVRQLISEMTGIDAPK